MIHSGKKLVVVVSVVTAATYLVHLKVGEDFKGLLGIGAGVDGDAFGVLQTLVGLVFSVMLGQTYQFAAASSVRRQTPGPGKGCPATPAGELASRRWTSGTALPRRASRRRCPHAH